MKFDWDVSVSMEVKWLRNQNKLERAFGDRVSLSSHLRIWMNQCKFLDFYKKILNQITVLLAGAIKYADCTFADA